MRRHKTEPHRVNVSKNPKHLPWIKVGKDTAADDDVIVASRHDEYLPIAFVSSRFALRIENLNFALTSDLLQETRSK